MKIEAKVNSTERDDDEYEPDGKDEEEEEEGEDGKKKNESIKSIRSMPTSALGSIIRTNEQDNRSLFQTTDFVILYFISDQYT